MADESKRWCSSELSKLLGTDVGEELTDYLFSIENTDDVREYLFQILDAEDDSVMLFIQQLCQKWPSLRNNPPSANTERKHDGDKRPSNTSSNQSEVVSKQQNVKQSPPKKKAHFVSLYSEEGKNKTSVRLPGRHPCECLGQKHKLINNCLHCGRIVCEQEGSGPCYFCGEVVCTQEEHELLSKTSKRSQKLKEKLLSTWDDKAKDDEESKKLVKATELKDRLLEFDRTSVRRTKVIDDESDYFTSDSKWLNNEQRKLLKAKEENVQRLKHRSRKDMKFTLDFAGRKVVEEDVSQEIDDLCKSAEEYLEAISRDELPSHPNYVNQSPMFIENDEISSKRGASKKKGQTQDAKAETIRTSVRLQDKELLEMSDTGQCLSMHQPWASLLVSGVKRAEGRVWYTTHRGRLWIAATAKKPNQDEIDEYENFYRSLGFHDFPQHYPSACLLGCVDVVDCLPQNEYQEKFHPNEESGSPFVFICENPRELPFKFPVKGKHKIWKLEKHIHQAAKKGLK